MKKGKSLFLLLVLLMGIVTNLSLSVSTIIAFGEGVAETDIIQETKKQTDDSLVSSTESSSISEPKITEEIKEQETTETRSELKSASEQNERRETQDITTLTGKDKLSLDKVGKPTILKNAEISNSGTELTPISVGDKINATYDFDIPEELYLNIQEGDYFEFDLPKTDLVKLYIDNSVGKSQPLKDQSGETHGTIIISESGHAKISFFKANENLNGIRGSIYAMLQIQGDSGDFPGKHEVPFTQVPPSIESGFVYVKSNQAQVSHQFIDQKIENNHYTSLSWKIIVNPLQEDLTRATLKQTLDGTNLKQLDIIKAYTADISIDGSKIIEKEPVTLVKDSQGNIKFPAGSKETYIIYTKTTLSFGVISDISSTVRFTGSKPVSDIQKVNVQGATLITKSSTQPYASGQPLFWEAVYNPENVHIPKDEAVITDAISGSNHEIIKESIQLTPNLPHILEPTNKGFKIKFQQDVTEKVVITYQTKYLGGEAELASNRIDSGKQSSLAYVKVPPTKSNIDSTVKKRGTVKDDVASWTIIANEPRTYQEVDTLEKIEITDTLDSGYIILDESKENKGIIVERSSTGNTNSFTAVSPDKYTLDLKKRSDGKTNGFNLHLENAGKFVYQIRYNSDISEVAFVDQERKLKNTADYDYSPAKNGTSPKKATYSIIDQRKSPLVKMTGTYLPKKNQIEWSAYVNENRINLAENAELKIPITEGLELVPNSVKLEYSYSPSSTTWSNDYNASSQYNAITNEITAKFKPNSYQRRVVFRTTSEMIPDGIKEVGMTGFYQDDYTNLQEFSGSVVPVSDGSTFLNETGTNNTVTNIVNWKTTINLNELAIQDVSLTNNEWQNMKVIKNTIKLTEHDTISRLDRPLIEGQDYQLIYTERSFQINFLKDFSNNKVTLLFSSNPIYPPNSLGMPFVMSNDLSISGSNISKDSEQRITTGVSGVVPSTGGGVEGKTGRVIVNKADALDTSIMLPDAEFTLYRGNKIDPEKIVDIRKTNSNGKIFFNELTFDHYLLVETKAPDGYQLNASNQTAINLKTGVTEDDTEIRTITNRKYTDILTVVPVKVRWQGVPNSLTKPDVLATLTNNHDLSYDKTLTSENNFDGNFEEVRKFTSDGELIEYSLETTAIPDFKTEVTGSSQDGFVITNTYEGKREVKGAITWDDYQNKFLTRPENVEISLFRNNQPTGQTQIVPTNNTDVWNYTFDDLLEYDPNATPYNYTVYFGEVDKYTQEIEVSNPLNVSYQYKNTDQVSKQVTKMWDDYSNKFDTRPDSVKVELYQNDAYLKDMLVSGSKQENIWSSTFENLPKYDSLGEEYRYTIKEVLPETSPYHSELKGDIIKNTYLNTEKVSLTLESMWDDNGGIAGKRPGHVTVEVLQNNRLLSDKTTQLEGNTDIWKKTVADLPKYDENGNLYVYSARQEIVADYQTRGPLQTSTGFKFENSYRTSDEIEIEGTVTILDYENKFGTRPETINLRLYRDNQPTDQTRTLSLNRNNDYGYSFGSQKNTDDTTNNNYSYQVVVENEDEFLNKGYTKTLSTDERHITFEYLNQATIEINGTKKWDDYHNQFDTRPDKIAIDLFQNERFLKTLTLDTTDTSRDEFSFKISQLPRYDTTGVPYRYSAIENIDSGTSTLMDYQTSYLWLPDNFSALDFGDVSKNVLITNTYKNLETKSLTITKKWDDYHNKFNTRPESITFVLSNNNGEVLDEQIVVQNPNDDSDTWYHEITNLPIYDEQGNTIKYKVDEKVPNNYQLTQISNDTSLFVNTYRNTDKETVTVDVAWDDEENKLNLRPDSTSVVLYQNGVKFQENTITKEMNNYAEFNDLPKFDSDGELYEYTISQKEVAQYQLLNKDELSTAGTSFTIKNKFINTATIDLSGSINWIDSDEALSSRPDHVQLMLIQKDSDGKSTSDNPFKTIKVNAPLNKQNNQWYFSFDDLPQYDDYLEAYDYEIVQEAIDNYQTSIADSLIINTYTYPEKTKAEGKVTWNDYSNEFNTRPEKLKLILKQNGVKVDEKEIYTTSDTSNYTFDELKKFDSEGKVYTYTVEQSNLPNEYTVKADGFNFINTFVNEEKITIEGNITWDDYRNEFDTRADKLKLTLKQNGLKVDEKEISTDSDTSNYAFDELKKFDSAGKAYIYTVEQSNLPSKYTVKVDGFNFINTFVNEEQTKIEGNVSWNDYHNEFGTRPEKLKLTLKQNGVKIDEKEISTTSDTSNYTFDALKKFDSEGKTYSYTVEQSNLPSKYTVKVDGFNFTNTFVNEEKTNVEGNVSWNDYHNEFDTRADKLKLTLKQNGLKVDEKEISTDSDTSNYAFDELKKFDSAGKAYIYTVEQSNLPNEYTVKADGFNFTNTFVNEEKTKIEGNVSWNDYSNKFDTRPEKLALTLKQNGVKVDEVEISTDSDTSNYTFDELKKFDSAGKAYTYTVEQMALPDDYTTAIDGFSFTNTFEVTEKELATVNGEIVWDDYHNKFNTRPEAVTIELYANQKLIDTKIVSAQQTDTWAFEFKNLVKNDETNKEINYTTKQVVVEKYHSQNNQHIITNRYRNNELTEMKVALEWIDVGNKLNTRPEKISVTLYDDQQAIEKIEVTRKNNYKHTFNDLPKYDKEGNEIEYRVEQEKIKNYQTEITYQRNTTNFRNTYQNKETLEVSGNIIWKNDSKQLSKRPEKVRVNLYQQTNSGINLLMESIDVTPDKDGQWHYTFKELKKYDSRLDTYQYSVAQEKIATYETTYDRFDIINTRSNKDISILPVTTINKIEPQKKTTNKKQQFPATGENLNNEMFYLGLLTLITSSGIFFARRKRSKKEY
ncbi:Cna B-type domain-containing protein [Vagococcus hydrophili]|uniref:Cna B-type domain-containing protein n=1 Tax=Vagococcus hydrophili TaxID=2714947 RepID=A0A6G8AW62_9ENTE|nr:Cna B-type domain-containing protein [Vagococcus hydrophili]QIL49237.1 Cna B-type domain-containing protein [Vagococcus hydrophili]